jgi:hypothetical protein
MRVFLNQGYNDNGNNVSKINPSYISGQHKDHDKFLFKPDTIWMESKSANNSCNMLLVKLLQSLVIITKHLIMRTNCIQNLQLQTSKHKFVCGMHAWYQSTEITGTPFFTNVVWFSKFLHQCNYYNFRLLTSSSMPGNWIFVSDASEGCSNTQKMKCLYYKHIWYTVPQKRTPSAICTTKHAVLMIVCQQWTYKSLLKMHSMWKVALPQFISL